MAREPRERLVLELLKDDWGNGDVDDFGITPKISFGWFEEDVDQPQVTVGQPEESPVDGGQTGYSHISADGDPGQTVGGTIDVHVWSSTEDLDAQNASTSNPREFNERACEEVQRIVSANAASPTNPATGNDPVSSIAYDGRQPVPEPDRDDVFHYVAIVQYGYED